MKTSLPSLSESPSTLEMDQFLTAIIRKAGPQCDVSQVLWTLRHTEDHEDYCCDQQESIDDQFEIAYLSLPPRKEELYSIVNRLKSEVWGDRNPSNWRNGIVR